MPPCPCPAAPGLVWSPRGTLPWVLAEISDPRCQSPSLQPALFLQHLAADAEAGTCSLSPAFCFISSCPVQGIFLPSPLTVLCVLQAPAGFCCAEQRPGQAGEAGGQRPVPGTSLLQPELLGHLGSTRRELLQDCVAVTRHGQAVEPAEHRRPSAFQERALALTE